MNKKRKLLYIVIAIALALGGVTTVLAITLEDPTTTWHVTPYNIPYTQENRVCENGTIVTDQFQSLMDGDTSGSQSITYDIDGMPVTMTITWYVDNTFDFEVTGGVVHKFMVKGGGATYLIYQYDPKVPLANNDGPVSYDTGLHDGINDQGIAQDFSHLEFCLTPKGEPLTAEKTAETSYTREYTWDITKEADGEYKGFIGDPAIHHNYEVSVDQTITESLFKVFGTITVYNANIFAVDTTVSDMVDGVAATIDCGGGEGDTSLTVPANGSATCDYYAFPPAKTDGTNTATITSLHPYVDGTTAEKAYAFGDPTTVVGYPTINVTDSFEGALGSASEDKTFDVYSNWFRCSGDPADYVDGVWTMDEFVNTATIDETGQSDTAKVNLICYAPLLNKDASTSWEKKYDWTITKEPDGSYTGFIGDPAFDHNYIVHVDQTITEQKFMVYGNIYVTNPAGSPGNMTVSLADELAAGELAVVDCGAGATSVTVAPGETEICTYHGTLPAKTDGINTATGAFNGVNGFAATAAYAFGDPLIIGHPTINVTDDKYGPLGLASGDKDFAIIGSFQCPADKGMYTDGVYTMPQFVNTATIDETGQSDTAMVDLICYAPVVTKDASTSWEKKYDWTITKDYDEAYKGFIGDPAFDHNYVVFADQTITDQNFKVYGKIYVENPAGSPGDMTVSLVDKLDVLTSAAVDCGAGSTSVTVASGATGSCDYSGYLAAKADGTNKATGTFNGVGGFEATAPFVFGEPTILGYSTINVTDDDYGALGSASEDTTFNYAKSFQCSSNPADYKMGVWIMEEFVNTATIDETGQSDDAHVNLTCYAPRLDKNGSALYDERHIWDIDKKVGPNLDNLMDLWQQGGFPGDVLPWTWFVEVSETFVEENFSVTGQIIVINPAGSPGNMTVSLEDRLNDGTFATVDCDKIAAGDQAYVTVAPGTSKTCKYIAVPGGRTATVNTATGTFNGIDFSATYPFSFVKNVVDGTATATDTEIGLDEALTAGEGPWPFSKAYSHTCSSNRADYFDEEGYNQMTETIINWAYVHSDGVEQDKDDAATTWTCDASFVDIYKTTNGEPADPTKDISFALYSGTTKLETVSTLNNGASLQFQTALVPGGSYTICEAPVPAGYTFEISVDGGNVLTYAGPPGEANPTGEIQCFDFTAKPSGNTLTYNINNSYPGGAPRTPGYWKNWNRCSGGNQADTADKLNEFLGPIDGAGVFLLDDLLPQTLGDWEITTCEDGILILDSRDVDYEKNMSNDAAYTLAKALLAARLNQDAGACVPMDLFDGMTFEEVLTAADGVLSDVKFDGTGDYLGPKNKKDKELAVYALHLYEIIDDYNNSELCTGKPSH